MRATAPEVYRRGRPFFDIGSSNRIASRKSASASVKASSAAARRVEDAAIVVGAREILLIDGIVRVVTCERLLKRDARVSYAALASLYLSLEGLSVSPRYVYELASA